MATTLDVIRRLTVIAQSKGVDELRREMESIAAAQNKAGEAALGVSRKFDNLEKSLFPVIKAQKALEAAARTAFNAVAEGATDASRAANLLAAAGEKYNAVAIQSKTASQQMTEALAKQKQAYIEEGRAIREAAAAQEHYNRVLGVPNEAGAGARSSRNQAIADQMRGRAAEQDRLQKESEDQQKRMVGLRTRYDEAYAAGRKYSQAVKEINELHKQGQLTDEKRMQLLQRQKHEYTRVIEEEIGGGRERGLGKSPGNRLALHQARNLGFQVNDVLTGLFSGQSVGMIAAQQGGQIYQILSDGPGGAAGGVKRLMGYLGDLVTPARLATGAVVAFGVAAAMAMKDAADRTVALGQALNGLGSASGLNTSALSRLASDAAGRSSTVSIYQAQQQAAAFARTGMDAGSIAGLTGDMTDRFAKSFGVPLEEATKTLAQAFQNPADGARTLGRLFGTINDAQMESIKRVQETGDVQRAQRMLLEALNRAMQDVTPQFTALTHSTEVLKKAISDLWARFGEKATGSLNFMLGLNDPQEALRRARTVVEEGRRVGLDKLADGSQKDSLFARLFGNEDVDRFKKALALIQESQKKSDEDKIAQEKKTAEILATQRAAAAAQFVRDATPWEERAKELRKQIESIGGSDPSKMDGGSVARSAEAMERLANSLRMVLNPMQQIQLNSALQIQQTLALSLAQRAAVDAQRAYTNAIGEGKTRAEAIAAAEASINQARAEGLRQAQEALRDARNQTALAGLLPDERLRLEIRQQEESLRRQSVVGATADLPAVLVPFKLGLDLATAALNEFTAALKPGGGVGRQAGIPDDQWRAQVRITDRVPTQPRVINPFNDTLHGPFGTAAFAIPWRDPEMERRIRESNTAEWNRQTPGETPFGGRPAVQQSRPAQTPAGGLAVDPNATERIVRQVTAERELGREREINLRFIRQTEIATTAMNATLDSQIRNFGRSTAEVSAAAKQQELLNQAAREGVPITDALQQSISRVSNEYGQAAARQERFRESLQLMNDVRGTVSDFGSSLAGAFIRGERGAKLLQTGLNSLLNSLSRMSMNLLMRGLFGDQNFSGGFLSQFMGAFLPGGGGGGGAPAVASARGNVFAYGSHVTAYAGGGVVHRPTFFPMARGGVGLMGEAGPEAIMPLRRGPDGRLGVAAANSNSPGVTVINENYTRANIDAKEERGPDGRTIIRQIIRDETSGMIASGEFDGAYRGRYSSSPRKVFNG